MSNPHPVLHTHSLTSMSLCSILMHPPSYFQSGSTAADFRTVGKNGGENKNLFWDIWTCGWSRNQRIFFLPKHILLPHQFLTHPSYRDSPMGQGLAVKNQLIRWVQAICTSTQIQVYTDLYPARLILGFWAPELWE